MSRQARDGKRVCKLFRLWVLWELGVAEWGWGVGTVSELLKVTGTQG